MEEKKSKDLLQNTPNKMYTHIVKRDEEMQAINSLVHAQSKPNDVHILALYRLNLHTKERKKLTKPDQTNSHAIIH